jgi:hypothetical protein
LCHVKFSNGLFKIHPGILCDSAFQGCTNLSRLFIPASVESFDHAFSGCTGLKWIEVDVGNVRYHSVDGILYNRAMTELLLYPASRPDSTFHIPASVEGIGSCAFTSSRYLQSLVFPPNLWLIDHGAFSYSQSLRHLSLPPRLLLLCAGSFYRCPSLHDLHIPSSVEDIGREVIAGCRNLAGVDLETGSHYISIDGGLYNRSGEVLLGYAAGNSATTYQIPEGVIEISDAAFLDAVHLEHISVPSSVARINSEAFQGCSGLRSISLPHHIEHTGEYLFKGCVSLRGVTLPENTFEITYQMFSGCTSLESITLPASITSIRREAFDSCVSLSSIDIPYNVESIYRWSFRGCTNLRHVTLHRVIPYYDSSWRDSDLYPFVSVPLELCTLHVPTGAGLGYKEAECWNEFGTIAEF